MFCTKCGKQIPDSTKFCPYCGANCSPEQDIAEMCIRDRSNADRVDRIMSVQELINEIMTDYRLNKSDI